MHGNREQGRPSRRAGKSRSWPAGTRAKWQETSAASFTNLKRKEIKSPQSGYCRRVSDRAHYSISCESLMQRCNPIATSLFGEFELVGVVVGLDRLELAQPLLERALPRKHLHHRQGHSCTRGPSRRGPRGILCDLGW